MEPYNKASEHLQEGQRHQFAEPPDNPAAEKAYRNAVQAAPEWGEPYHWLGAVLERQGKVKEAEGAYQRAIQLLPVDPRPLVALGRLQVTCGQYEEAIGHLAAGLALKPHYAEADARLFLAEALSDPALSRKQSINGKSFSAWSRLTPHTKGLSRKPSGS